MVITMPDGKVYEILTLQEAAQAVGLKACTIRTLAAARKIRGRKPDGSWRFFKDELVEDLRYLGTVKEEKNQCESSDAQTALTGKWNTRTLVEREYVKALRLNARGRVKH